METTQTKHTPAPWNWEPLNGELIVKECSDGSSFTLAEVNTKNPVWEANARLIAAAPELLEACKLVMRGTSWLTVKDFEFIRNAISKAEGQ